MVTFCFNSFGKLKLLVARLSKITNHVYCRLLANYFQLVFNDSFVQTSEITITKGTVPEDGEIFKVNLVHFHNVLKNIPATYACHWELDNVNNKIRIITDVSNKRTIRHNSTTIDFVHVDKLPSHRSGTDCNNTARICVNNMIWIMDKFLPCFEHITLSFNERKLSIIGNDEEYDGSSSISLDHGNIGIFSKTIDSNKFVQLLWILEWASCNCSFYIEPSSLEFFVISNYDEEIVLLKLR